jgi:FkbM family methyltransferase
MNGTYIGNDKMIIRTQWGGILVASASDRSLMPSLVLTGTFDIGLTKFFINNLKPGHIVFDVGANLGYFSVLASYLIGDTGKIVSYEANATVFELLEENASLNGLFLKGEIHNKAIYSKKDTLEFNVSEKLMGNSSIFEPDQEYDDMFKIDTFKKVKVEAEPLDVYVDKYECIDLIKIDIEGGEYHALLGMEKLLEQKKVRNITFELNKLRMKENWNDMHELLKKYEEDKGFRFYNIDRDGNPQHVTLEMLFEKEFVENVLIKCY